MALVTHGDHWVITPNLSSLLYLTGVVITLPRRDISGCANGLTHAYAYMYIHAHLQEISLQSREEGAGIIGIIAFSHSKEPS